METPNSFTVDLTQLGIVVPGTDLSRQQRVQQRVDELIQPGHLYSIVDTDGDPIGTIGARLEVINIDEEADLIQERIGEMSDCESEEDVDAFLFALDVEQAILDKIDYPANNDNYYDHRTPIQRQQEWINEQRGEADDRRKVIREEVAEAAEDAMACNGVLVRQTGKINHHGQPCPIHDGEITEPRRLIRPA